MGNSQETNEDVCYVVTNEWMPGIVKLGKTQITKAKTRIARLYSTSVPEAFCVDYAVRVKDRHEAERLLFGMFEPYRINPKREFFKITVGQAVNGLNALKLEDVTKIVRGEVGAYEDDADDVVDIDDMEDAEEAQEEEKSSKNPALNFDDLEIPAGTVLKYIRDGITATVVSGRQINYEGEDFFPSKLTGMLDGRDYPLPAGPWWTVNDRLLQDVYDEVHRGGENHKEEESKEFTKWWSTEE